MNEDENKVEVTETETIVEEPKEEATEAVETTVEEAPVEEAPAEEAPAEEAPAEEKKELDAKDLLAGLKKNIKWIAIAVVALILICIIGSCAANGGSAFPWLMKRTAITRRTARHLFPLTEKKLQ